MAATSIEQRLAELEARIAVLESHVEISPRRTPQSHPDEQRLLKEARSLDPFLRSTSPVEAESSPQTREVLYPDEEIRPSFPAPSAPPVAIVRSLPRASSAALRDGTLSSNAVGQPPRSAPQRSAAVHSARLDLERIIGGRLFGAVGAVAVVIGVGLFFQMAYRMGWMNLIPPGGKCLIGAAFGCTLIGAGELVRRRLNAAASAGISAAGLGTLYAAAWAAWNLQLVPAALAFVMLALIAALGFVVAARARSATLAVLALIGGYINPFIIGGGGPALIMPTYLLTLLIAGLALSAWRARPFRVLRSLVWWGSVLVGTLWTMNQGLDVPSVALLFIGLVWVAMHTELAASAGAVGILVPGADRERWSAPAASPAKAVEQAWARMRFIATSFTTTIWTAALAAWVLRHGTPLSDWLAPAFAAVMTIVVASVLVGHLRILREWPRTDLERLGAGLAMQGGGLLMAAVSLALSGSAQVTAWLALGLAAIFAGRWIRSRGLDVYGMVMLALGTARLFLIDGPYILAPAWSYNLGGIILSTWTLLMVLAAAAWAITSVLLSRGLALADAETGAPIGRGVGEPQDIWNGIATACTLLFPTLLAWSLVDPAADPASVAFAWLIIGLGTMWACRAIGIASLAVHGLVVLGLSGMLMLAWVVGRGPGWTLASSAGLVISRWTLLMLAFAAGCAAAARMAPKWGVDVYAGESDSSAHRLGLHHMLVAAGAASLLGAFWHPEVSAASLTLLWLAMSGAILVLHRTLPRLGLDLIALAAMASAAMAWAIAWMPGWTITPGAPLLHSGFLSSLLLSGAVAGWVAWLHPSGRLGSPGPTLAAAIPPVAAAGSLLLLVSTSLEVARSATVISGDDTARNAAVSIWWGLFAAALLVIGFLRRRPLLRHSGLGLITLATIKAVAIDLAAVPPIWRIASFIALGLLMLGIAAAYLRISTLLGDRPHPDDSAGSDDDIRRPGTGRVA